jgi:hypothetical protein
LERLVEVENDPSLRAKAEAMLAAWTRNGSKPSTRYGGSDSAKCIQVVVDPDGDVIDLLIDPNWSASIAGPELPRALFQAYLSAIQIAASARLLTSHEESVRAAEAIDVNDVEMEPALERFNDAIELIERRKATEGDISPRNVVSPGGFFALRFEGRDLIGIETGPRSLIRARSGDLREDLLAALRRMP